LYVSYTRRVLIDRLFSITTAYPGAHRVLHSFPTRRSSDLVIGSKHITLNATGGGFLTASKQFRHGATSKSRSNTASNSTKHKSPHLSGWRQIISLIT